MTLNDLLRQAQTIAGQLSGGDVPMTVNGKQWDLELQMKTDKEGHPVVNCEIIK